MLNNLISLCFKNLKLYFSYIQYFFPLKSKSTYKQLFSLIFFPKFQSNSKVNDKISLELLVKSYSIIFTEIRANRFIYLKKKFIQLHLQNLGLLIKRLLLVNATVIRFSRFYKKFEKKSYDFLLNRLVHFKNYDLIAFLNYRRSRYVTYKPFESNIYTGKSRFKNIISAQFELIKLNNKQFYYTYSIKTCFLVIFHFKANTFVLHEKKIINSSYQERIKNFNNILLKILKEGDILKSIILFNYKPKYFANLINKLTNKKVKIFKVDKNKINNFKIFRDVKNINIFLSSSIKKTGTVEDYFPLSYKKVFWLIKDLLKIWYKYKYKVLLIQDSNAFS